VSTFVPSRTPVLFAVSAAQALPGLHGSNVFGAAAGIVVLVSRRFDRGDVAATLGAHILSPAWLSAAPLEERVAEVLRGVGLEIPLSRRVPAMVSLPSGLPGSVPVVVLTLNVTTGLERLEAFGRALRELREEGVVLAGIAHDGPGPSGTSEMLATMSLLLGAAHEDDRVAELGTRGGGAGFVLAPESHDAVDDAGCCFWSAESAGELPAEVLQQLRPYLRHADAGENQDHMARKKTAAIHVTRFDKTRLMQLLRSLDAAQENRDEIEDLERELERGTEVESTAVGPDVVTMNSTVRVTDLDTNTTHLYTIVFPAEADFEKGRISILSPLGTALLGYRAGDVVTWEMPRGTRRLRIEELVYQPEAAGDFHL
jgi:regulator of nucleoside diphosphate kinase